MTSEFIEVAEDVLRQSSQPMTAQEIVDEGVDRGLFSDQIAGKTPHQTMKSKLSVWIRTHGDDSIFVRTAPGRFWLREKVSIDNLYEAPRYEKPPSKERVLVFHRSVISSLVSFQGVSTSWKYIHQHLIASGKAEYMERMIAERSNDYKQILSYILVTRRDKVLSFRRGKYNRVEDYLRGSLCIGFGGHVALEDDSLLSGNDYGIRDSAVRELMEELRLPKRERDRLVDGKGLTICGVLNDDSSDVGRRHLAFVFRFELSARSAWKNPEKGEKSIAQLEWISPTNGPHKIWKFEYWSQLCMRKFFPKLAEEASDYRLVRRTSLINSKAIALIGSIGSGKSEASRILTESYGYKEVNSGRILASLLHTGPVTPQNRASFQARALRFIRKPQGPRLLAEAIWKEVEAHGADGRLVIDGIRQRETLDELRRLSRDSVAVLYVHTLPDIAYEFFCARERADTSFEEFLALRDAEVERDVYRMLRLADCVIYNWRGKRQYLSTVRQLMREIFA